MPPFQPVKGRWQIFSRADQCGGAGCTICHLRARQCRVHGKGWGCETPNSLGGTPKQWLCGSVLRWEAGAGTRQGMPLKPAMQLHTQGVLQVENPFTAAMPVCPKFPSGEAGNHCGLCCHCRLCCHPPPLVSCFSGAPGHQRGCECQSGQCLGSRGCGASQDLLHHCTAVHRSVQSCRAEERAIISKWFSFPL